MNTAYTFIKNYIPLRNELKSRTDGDFLIISNRNGEIYYLNGSARDMWLLLDGSISIDELCGKILGEYKVDREQLENDIVNFIRDLQWKKLLRLRTGGLL